jgi:hypothetical protein
MTSISHSHAKDDEVRSTDIIKLPGDEVVLNLEKDKQ